MMNKRCRAFNIGNTRVHFNKCTANFSKLSDIKNNIANIVIVADRNNLKAQVICGGCTEEISICKGFVDFHLSESDIVQATDIIIAYFKYWTSDNKSLLKSLIKNNYNMNIGHIIIR